jgi:hypothetical protein
MNIFFVVLLAVFWAIGGIIKARTKKAKEGVEEPVTDKRVRKFPGTHPFSPLLTKQYRQQVEQLRSRIVRSRPMAPSIATEKKSITIPSVKSLEKPKLSRLKHEFQTSMGELPKRRSESIEAFKDNYTTISTERTLSFFQMESLLDYTNIDELRKAILHYEILGKPLSLRRPGENTIGF